MFNLKAVRDEITALMLAWPELADDKILREDMIEGSTSAFEFVSTLLRKIGGTTALIEGTKAYKAELQERIERLERREHALRQLIKKVMELANLPKMERPEATVTIKHGPAKVIITDESALPDPYWRIKREPDKVKIGLRLKDGIHIDGAVLSNPELVLQIRIR